MRITGVTSTDLFVGSRRQARQVIGVSVASDAADAGRDVSVRVDGAGVATPAPSRVTAGPPGETVVAEVAVEVSAPYQPGVARPVTVVAETGAAAGGAPQAYRAAGRGDPGRARLDHVDGQPLPL